MSARAAARRQRSAALDGVRGLAALSVLLFHAELAGLAGGLLGVDLFFVLSGFLITRLLLDEHERSGSLRLGRFWARRTVRLWPPLAALLVAGLLAARTLSPDGTLHGYLREAFSAGTWSMNIVAARRPEVGHPLGHTWTLAMEEQFYLLWPPVLLLLLLRTRLRRHVVPLLLAAAACSWVLLFVLWKDTSFLPAVYVRPDTRALPLLVGCALAFTVRSAGQRWRSVVASPWCGGAALLGLVATVTLIGRGTSLRFILPVGTVAISVAAYALIAHTEVARDGLVARLVGARPLAAVGTISYSLYLVQNPLLRVVERSGYLAQPTVHDAFARIPMLLAAGALLWVTVERPLRPLLARLGASVPAADGPQRVARPATAGRPRARLPLRLSALGALGAVPVLFVAAGTAAGLRWTHVPAPLAPRGPSPAQQPGAPATAGPTGGGPRTGSTSGTGTRSTGGAAGATPGGSAPAGTGPVRSGAPAGGVPAATGGGSTGIPVTIPSLPVTVPGTVPASLPVTVPTPSIPVTVPATTLPRVAVTTPPVVGTQPSPVTR